MSDSAKLTWVGALLSTLVGVVSDDCVWGRDPSGGKVDANVKAELKNTVLPAWKRQEESVNRNFEATAQYTSTETDPTTTLYLRLATLDSSRRVFDICRNPLHPSNGSAIEETGDRFHRSVLAVRKVFSVARVQNKKDLELRRLGTASGLGAYTFENSMGPWNNLLFMHIRCGEVPLSELLNEKTFNFERLERDQNFLYIEGRFVAESNGWQKGDRLEAQLSSTAPFFTQFCKIEHEGGPIATYRIDKTNLIRHDQSGIVFPKVMTINVVRGSEQESVQEIEFKGIQPCKIPLNEFSMAFYGIDEIEPQTKTSAPFLIIAIATVALAFSALYAYRVLR